MRRWIVIAVALLLLVGGCALAWTLLGWPPPRLVLKYGLEHGVGNALSLFGTSVAATRGLGHLTGEYRRNVPGSVLRG